jgi:hypothetical protein
MDIQYQNKKAKLVNYNAKDGRAEIKFLEGNKNPFWVNENEVSYSQSQAVERFKFPTDKQIIDFAIVFNDGKIEKEKLADMVAMCEMILHRLHENGDVTIPSKNEN